MAQLSRLAIRPLRIAFDSITLEKTYRDAVKMAHKYGVNEISNYILFNYKDKPEDLYNRLKVNIELNRELGINIFSFPMRFAPIERTDRKYVGEHWNRKYLAAISGILQVTKGIVASGSGFFYKAFGNNLDEYFELLAMPRNLIIYRSHFEKLGITQEWRELYRSLSAEQKKTLLQIVSLPASDIKTIAGSSEFQSILPYYIIPQPTKEDLAA